MGYFDRDVDVEEMAPDPCTPAPIASPAKIERHDSGLANFSIEGKSITDVLQEKMIWSSYANVHSPATSRLAEIPPVISNRFLHSGPLLSSVASISHFNVPLDKNTVTAASWRTFTDSEEERLQKAWEILQREGVDLGGEKLGEDGEVETVVTKLPEVVEPVKDSDEPVSDPDDEPQLHVVPVGVDSLFSVNLETMLLSPDFWEGETVRCMLAAWFYPPKIEETSTSRIHRKIYPVDPDLAIELEKAYRSIAPFSATYAAELSSAVSSNLSMAESQAKLRIDLLGGTVAVLFEDGVKGRVYSKGFFGGIGRSGNGSISFGGGQEVLRGWEAVQNYSKGKSGSVTTPTKSSSTTSTPRPSSPTKQPSTSTGKIGSKIVDATKKSVAASPTVTGLIEVLKSKIGVAPPLTDTLVDSTTTTQDVLDDQVDPEPGELSELVLIVHGIGQKLAGTFSSLNFVHAANSLRSSCDQLSASSTLSPLLQGKRAQFIPIRWRADLEFDPFEDNEDEANQFSIDDIEIGGTVPLLRQVISGLALDVPFYLSRHKETMMRAVVKDANRIYRLFCERNPGFAENGKVSIIAHSLGSALSADILAQQPTRVKPLGSMTPEELRSETQFLFDTRMLFLVGSPLALFLHLTSTSLLARAGRSRATPTSSVPASKPGTTSLAIDSLYNVYNTTDPIAFRMNPVVDSAYSKLLGKSQGIAIDRGNKTLLENLSAGYNTVTKMLDGYWSKAPVVGEPESTEGGSEGGGGKEIEESNKDDLEISRWEEKRRRSISLPPSKSDSPTTPRPEKLKRLPSQRPGISAKERTKYERAEAKFKALNPQGTVDFILPAEGINEYLESLSSHGSYWFDVRFHTFVLSQLFVGDDDLERSGREEIGSED